jgi:hypothetical protein
LASLRVGNRIDRNELSNLQKVPSRCRSKMAAGREPYPEKRRLTIRSGFDWQLHRNADKPWIWHFAITA